MQCHFYPEMANTERYLPKPGFASVINDDTVCVISDVDPTSASLVRHSTKLQRFRFNDELACR